MKKMKRISALFMALLLFCSAFVSGIEVNAAEMTGAESAETIENVEDETSEIAGDGADLDIPDDQDSPAGFDNNEEESGTAAEEAEKSRETSADEEKIEEIITESGLINYVGVEQPYLTSPGTQKIAVSYGDGTESVANARIVYQKADGTVYEDVLTERRGELFLFEHSFGAGDKGVYTLLRFVYTENGVEHTVPFSDIGIQAMFGVDEEYPGYNAADEEISEEDIDISVVEVESDNVEAAKTDVEDAIEETADMVDGAEVMSLARAAAARRNYVVVLDPGHGGNDVGATANGLYEKDLTLKISKYCKEELEQYSGITVYMTRETDIRLGADASSDLKNRVDKAAAWGADLLVSLHINAGGATGVEVYYPNSNYKPSIGAEGKNAAQQIYDKLVELGLNGRGIKIRNTVNDTYADGSKQDYYGIIRHSKLAGFPGIIVEHAFIDNASDAAKLKDEAFLKKCGIADATGIANYFGVSKGTWVEYPGSGWKYEDPDGNCPKDCWQLIDGNWYHFDKEGYRQTGWLTLGDTKFYLEADGIMQTGWKVINGVYYYFNSGGAMQTGWLLLGNIWYYMNTEDNSYGSKGAMRTGWLQLGNNRFYLNEDMYSNNGQGAMATGWRKIDGVYYYFNSGGAMQTGWLTLNGYKYYLGTDGKMVTGTVKIGDTTYTFNEGGVLIGEEGGTATGITQIGNQYFYIVNGVKQTGWHVINNEYFYFAADGAMQMGWLLLGNIWYYMNPEKDSNGSKGAMRTGWLQLGNNTFYLNQDKYSYNGQGTMATGWSVIDGVYYYFNSGGAMQTGWLLLGNIWYYMNTEDNSYGPRGAMCTGWLQLGNNRFYLNPDKYSYNGQGTMATGWRKIDGIYYYFNSGGAMQTGWLTLNGCKYYLGTDGKMVTGTVQIGSKTYIFNEGGVLIGEQGNSKLTQIDGKYYYIVDGVKKTGWQIIDGLYYYFASDGVMQTGWLLSGGVWYYMNPEDNDKGPIGAMQTGWLLLGSTWYYLNPDMYSYNGQGAMAVGWREIGNVYYYFNASGALRYTGVTPIMGTSLLGTNKTTAVNKMVTMYMKSGRTYPSTDLGNGGAATITDFCTILYEEAVAEGVKPEVVFGQSMKETGYLQFGGDVLITQYNFAGLGATGNGVHGNVFPDVRTGLRAQVQHLKAYASTEPLNNACVDQRFNYVKRGSAPYVEWLGIPENPNGGGWAAAKEYGFSLVETYITPML